jgi:hypothetical protein
MMTNNSRVDQFVIGNFTATVGNVQMKVANASMAYHAHTVQFNALQEYGSPDDPKYSSFHVVINSQTPPGKYSYPEDKGLSRLNYAELYPLPVFSAEITEGTYEIITDKSGDYTLSFDVVLGALNKLRATGKFEFSAR